MATDPLSIGTYLAPYSEEGVTMTVSKRNTFRTVLVMLCVSSFSSLAQSKCDNEFMTRDVGKLCSRAALEATISDRRLSELQKDAIRTNDTLADQWMSQRAEDPRPDSLAEALGQAGPPTPEQRANYAVKLEIERDSNLANLCDSAMRSCMHRCGDPALCRTDERVSFSRTLHKTAEGSSLARMPAGEDGTSSN